MTTIIQNSENYPIQYPFESSITPQSEKLYANQIPNHYIGNSFTQFFYPDFLADNVAYVAGVTKEKWDEFYKSIYIMCCELNKRNIIIVWSQDIVIRIYIEEINWRRFFPTPNNFIERLTGDYSVGFSVGLMENSVRKTLEMYLYPVPYQMPLNSDKNSKVVPSFDYFNIPAFDVAKDRNIYAHSSCKINLSHFNEVPYIKNTLCNATANGMKGVVFHCGSSVNQSIEDALKMLCSNIVLGIRAAKFTPDQIGTAKFILETPAGKGKEVLTDINQFISFCTLIKTNYPDVAQHFSVCVDTCHVHQCGYAPHKYLEEIHKIHPVELVHFNDSLNGWACRKDFHAKPGEGHIPWSFLLSVAEFCKINRIPAVYEN